MDLDTRVFVNKLGKFVNAYLGVILVYGKTLEDRDGHLNIVINGS